MSVKNYPLRKQENPENFVQIRGARQNNLCGFDLDIPRNSFVVFTGVSGSGKSSLAFGTIFAEAQRRYFESVAPYARRLIEQLPAPKVSEIRGLPPAVALQQRRGEPTARSSVGTLTNLANSLRMLFSRAGTYPAQLRERLDSDAFSPNTVAGACPACHGIGVVHTVSEESLVPDPNLSIAEKAIAAYPGAWQGKNYRDILAVLGYDIHKPWHKLSKKDREWILFTEEKPVVTVYAEREAHRIQRPYQGTYMSAAVYVRHTFGTTNSAVLRKRVEQFMVKSDCLSCHGKRLRAESLSVKFGGYDIAELSHMPLGELAKVLADAVELKTPAQLKSLAQPTSPVTSSAAKHDVAELIVQDLVDRIRLLSALGLDYLSMDRATPTLSAGELQRLRLTTLLRSGLFGVVYVLDEPSAGLHPADSQALLKMLMELKAAGNSLFVVEHDLEIVRKADWLVDIGPGAGEGGGQLIYSGPPAGLQEMAQSVTQKYLFARSDARQKVDGGKNSNLENAITLTGINRHNLTDLSVTFPLGLFTAVTGISGSGKSTLISQVLQETVRSHLGSTDGNGDEGGNRGDGGDGTGDSDDDSQTGELVDLDSPATKAQAKGLEPIKRLVCVDQKPIGRTPRSNLATYTGLFDHVRKAFASTKEAKARKYNAGRFSFNVVGGRCTICDGEGFVSVELMFLPTVYSPCSACAGTRYNEETLQIKWQEKNIAEVLDMTVDKAYEFFAEMAPVARALNALKQVGLGYLRLGQPATELSGGEAQRIRLASELQREQKGDTLYLLDEPTTGLHPWDVDKLMLQLRGLVAAGNTVVVVEHDMAVIGRADWVIDMGPGAGAAGGKVVCAGSPQDVAKNKVSRTAPFLKNWFDRLN